MSLIVRNLSCSAGAFRFTGVDLEVCEQTYFVLLGPSGAGKSTLLKCIMGIKRIVSGEILIGGKDVTRLAVEKRNIGYLPQNCILFPHLKVRENISFGLKTGNFSSSEAEHRVDELLDLLRIKHLDKRDTMHLSGGERQKVALARSLAVRPALLLLDEPFSAVDENARKELWFELKGIFKRIKIPFIHVTHNFDEAYCLADKIGVMIDGRLEQVAEPGSLFEGPETLTVARFLSYRNFFSGSIRRLKKGKYSLENRDFPIVFRTDKELKGNLTLCVRPQDIKIINPDYPIRVELRDNVYDVVIINVVFYPESANIFVKVEGSGQIYDFELKFPLYIYKRYQLYEGKHLQVAIWQPGIIVLA